MAFTYDVTTNRGKVRLLCTDTDAANVIFQDNEIDAFLTLMSSNVLRSGALALETIAGQQVLLLKVIKLLELSTDGASVARALLAQATKLKEQADAEEATEDGGAFDYAELVYDPFTWRERLEKEALREG